MSDRFKKIVFGFEEFKVIEFIVLISPFILTSNLSKLPSTVDDEISWFKNSSTDFSSDPVFPLIELNGAEDISPVFSKYRLLILIGTSLLKWTFIECSPSSKITPSIAVFMKENQLPDELVVNIGDAFWSFNDRYNCPPDCSDACLTLTL